jgi:hypothetical protein
VFFIMVMCFWGLALVCDHYFCSALMILCEETGIPENVAGVMRLKIISFICYPLNNIVH